MSSGDPYRGHSAQFKLQLCHDIRSGTLGRRDAPATPCPGCKCKHGQKHGHAAYKPSPKRGGQQKAPVAELRQGLVFGGVDGTRTRDPRRDRPVF